MNSHYRGDGFGIDERDGKYFISWPVGFSGERVEYEISKENADKAKKTYPDAREVMIYAESGHWPRSPEEKQALICISISIYTNKKT